MTRIFRRIEKLNKTAGVFLLYHCSPQASGTLFRGPLVGKTCGENLTNLADSGLRSVARNNKATRLLTRPGQTTKSSAKDLSLRAVKLQYASSPPGIPPEDGRRPAKVRGQRPIRIRLRRAGGNHPFLAWILT